MIFRWYPLTGSFFSARAAWSFIQSSRHQGAVLVVALSLHAPAGRNYFHPIRRQMHPILCRSTPQRALSQFSASQWIERPENHWVFSRLLKTSPPATIEKHHLTDSQSILSDDSKKNCLGLGSHINGTHQLSPLFTVTLNSRMLRVFSATFVVPLLRGATGQAQIFGVGSWSMNDGNDKRFSSKTIPDRNNWRFFEREKNHGKNHAMGCSKNRFTHVNILLR